MALMMPWMGFLGFVFAKNILRRDNLEFRGLGDRVIEGILPVGGCEYYDECRADNRGSLDDQCSAGG